MSGPESSIRRRELGRRLLTAQRGVGLTGIQLAERLGWNLTRLSRTMSGHRATPDTEVAMLLGVCGVTGAEADEALRLSRPHQDTALRLRNDDLWSAYLVHAGATVNLVEFQPFIVPWMVQTPDYTRALIADRPASHIDEDAHVMARRAAAELIRLPSVALFLHEWSLRTPLRDAALMSEQLHYLLQMSVLPSVSVRVVPIGQGTHAGLHGAFTLLEFVECSSVLYREGHFGGVMLDNDPALDAYRSVADHLDTIAPDDDTSREMIKNIAVELYGPRLQ